MNFLCLYFTASFVTTRVLGFSNIQRKNRPPVELYTSKNVLKPEGEKVNKDTGEFGFRELDNQNQIDTDVDQDEIILQTNEGGENKWERRKATNFVDELEKSYDLDDSLTILTEDTYTLMDGINILPDISSRGPRESLDQDKRGRKRRWFKKLFSHQQMSPEERARLTFPIERLSNIGPLPLRDPNHIARIERDVQHLAVSISSCVDTPQQWKVFCEDGGGISPLVQCIRDGAREVRQRGGFDVYDKNYEGILGIVEQSDEIFSQACSSIKVLRDLCAISKKLSAVITDDLLQVDATFLITSDKDRYEKKNTTSSGLVSDLVTMVQYSKKIDNISSQRKESQRTRDLHLGGVNIKKLGSRDQRIELRRKCGLYSIQLLLSMTLASDEAVNSLRATDGLTEAVLACSSYGKTERLRRRWIRYPVELLKNIFFRKEDKSERRRHAFSAAASVGEGLTGEIHKAANQVLAAIGHNVWYPKSPNQKGLRILCLDGGGTRGITAISTMCAIVDAIGGVELCDSFDMIAGTSTGAIIAFLVGLRCESSRMARKRYSRLMKRVFVKSALSTPMLLFTTATYDEAPFNTVMKEILGDESMLCSRADPRVPMVFAVSSKMNTSPTQLCLFRNYNYSGGEKKDVFVSDPLEARRDLELQLRDTNKSSIFNSNYQKPSPSRTLPLGNTASRHQGSFRVLQKAAMRATTAAPTVFKPVLMSEELFCDGGMVASNPAAIAIHEARSIFPDVPIEMVVSCGTGAFFEEKSASKIGWDGIMNQIVNSATDGEQIHHILEDILGQSGTAKLGGSPVSNTKYYRFNPLIGNSDTFPIDGTDPDKLRELENITMKYLKSPEQAQKIDEISEILEGNTHWRKRLFRRS